MTLKLFIVFIIYAQVPNSVKFKKRGTLTGLILRYCHTFTYKPIKPTLKA